MTATTSPAGAAGDALSVDLSAVIVAVTEDEPKVLAIRSDGPDALPSGRLESQHPTLGAGLRSWVERQTGLALGYLEQLYTFGDSNRVVHGSAQRVLSIGYLALVREVRSEPTGTGGIDAVWRDWYRYFPWEDWRRGKPAIVTHMEQQLRRWVADASGKEERALREARARFAFGSRDIPWSDDRVLERYELLYEVGLVPETHRDGRRSWAPPREALAEGQTMIADHRRVLATGIARLRGKIKYRPVVFELMPPSFRFLQLQLAVEALAGLRLHKSNFRRLVESQGLVEETGEVEAGTGGRPARLLRFRREVLLDRPALGKRLPVARRNP